jgi:hypothetical protein
MIATPCKQAVCQARSRHIEAVNDKAVLARLISCPKELSIRSSVQHTMGSRISWQPAQPSKDLVPIRQPAVIPPRPVETTIHASQPPSPPCLPSSSLTAHPHGAKPFTTTLPSSGRHRLQGRPSLYGRKQPPNHHPRQCVLHPRRADIPQTRPYRIPGTIRDIHALLARSRRGRHSGHGAWRHRRAYA